MASALRPLRAVVPLKAGIAGGGSDLPSYYLRRDGRCLNMALDVELTVDFDPSRRGDLSFSMPAGADTGFGTTMVENSGLLGHGSITITSASMPGWGLGCSSALLVALQALRRGLAGLPIDTALIAEEAWRVEAVTLGMPVGKQDHYASSFGGVNEIVFRKNGVRVEPLVLTPAGERLLDECLLIAGVGFARRASEILAGQDARCRSGDSDVLDAIDGRVSIVPRLADALRRGDLDAVGALMRHDWELKRRLAPRVYGDGVEEALEAALEAGAVAGRLLGAGSSGYLLLLARRDDRERVRLACEGRLRHVRRVAPAKHGVRVSEVE